MMTSKPTGLRIVVIAAMVSALGACVSIPEVSGSLKAGDGTYRLDRSWNDISQVTLQNKGVRLLTLDGPVLNSLYLSAGLKPGHHLVKPQSRREKTTASWRSDTGTLEQIEFVRDSIEGLAYERVETANPRPVSLAGQRGVRFDVTARTAQGLDIKGFGQVVTRGEQAYVALYLAPAEHFFDRSQASALRTMDSLVF